MAGGRRAVGSALLRLAAADELGVGRFAQHDPGLGPLDAQHARHARQRAAGAVAGDEPVEPLALEVGQDLARRRRLVDLGIGRRLELVRQEPAVGLGELDRLLVHAEALGGARGQHDLGTQHAHQLAALDREAVGHGHHQRIALLGAHHGEPDAGVAAGRLDHGLAGLQRAGALGRLDDVDREPVLDRRRRIERLGLDVELHALRSEIVDANARRVADRVEHAVEQPPASRRGPDFTAHVMVPFRKAGTIPRRGHRSTQTCTDLPP